ncbi:MAG: hypothetical protein ACREML_07900 [Vulcanimicrobiaceae bacterium]
MTVGPDGTLCVTEYTFVQGDTQCGLYIYPPSRSEKFVALDSNSNGCGAYGVDVDAVGNIYVAVNNSGINSGFTGVNNDTENEVEVFAPGGASVLRRPRNGIRPSTRGQTETSALFSSHRHIIVGRASARSLCRWAPRRAITCGLMTLNRIVIPALFVTAAFVGAITTGCHNTSTLATPTPSPVPTCASCTPLPTASPGGPTPTPSPTPTSYQPLANNDTWNYACNASVTAAKNVSTGPILQGVQTLADTLTVTDPGPPATYTLIADEANDGLGNTSVYQWVFGPTTTTLTTPGLEFGTNETVGQTSTYLAPGVGNFTTTFIGPIAAITTGGNTYSSVVEFKSVNSSPILSLYGEIDTKTQLAVGPVEIDFPNYTPALVCTLTGPPTINSVVRRH